MATTKKYPKELSNHTYGDKRIQKTFNALYFHVSCYKPAKWTQEAGI